MRRRIPPSTPLLLAALALTLTLPKPSSALAVTHPLLLLLHERTSSCPDTSYSTCADTSLPADFCCPPSAVCIALAANTTLLCCPRGEDCSSVLPIACDLALQNATLHPSNNLKTTALHVPLAVCGAGCCPFGFSCAGGVCGLDADQAASVPGRAASSLASSAATLSSPSSSTSSTPASSPATNTSSTNPPSSCSAFPATAILTGFFPGLLAGLLLSAAAILCLGHRRRTQSRAQPVPHAPPTTHNCSSIGKISDPVPTAFLRTDFLRKSPAAARSSSTLQRSTTISRVRSLFRKSNGRGSARASPGSVAQPWKTKAHARTGSSPPIPLLLQREESVKSRLQRESSYEDIDIFADNDTASALRRLGAALDGGERDGHGDGYRNRDRDRDKDRDSGLTAMSGVTTVAGMLDRSAQQGKFAGLQKGRL